MSVQDEDNLFVVHHKPEISVESRAMCIKSSDEFLFSHLALQGIMQTAFEYAHPHIRLSVLWEVEVDSHR